MSVSPPHPPTPPHPNNSLSSILFRLFIRLTQQGCDARVVDSGVMGGGIGPGGGGSPVCCRVDGLCSPSLATRLTRTP